MDGSIQEWKKVCEEYMVQKYQTIQTSDGKVAYTVITIPIAQRGSKSLFLEL